MYVCMYIEYMCTASGACAIILVLYTVEVLGIYIRIPQNTQRIIIFFLGSTKHTKT